MNTLLTRTVCTFVLAVTTASCTAQAEDVIKIGAPLALSGALADEGRKQAFVFDMWLQRVNAAGGIDVGGRKMRVGLTIYDYSSDGRRAQRLAEKLITDDGVMVLTAPFGPGHTKIVTAVAERYGIPIIASGALITPQRAIEKAGSLDPAKIRDALATLDATTLHGPIALDRQSVNSARPQEILQVQDHAVEAPLPKTTQQARLATLE